MIRSNRGQQEHWLRAAGLQVGCLLVAGILAAQTGYYRFEHLTIEDGLSQNLVYAVLQDHRGFMWFGTNDGLNRYDGTGFRVYRHSKAEGYSLASSKVTALFEDSGHVLWVGAGGLNRYDRLQDRFERVLSADDFPGNSAHGAIVDITEDHRGDLWVAIHNAGLFRVALPDTRPDDKQKPVVPAGDENYQVSGPYPYAVRQTEGQAFPNIKKIISIGSSLWVSYNDGVSKLAASDSGQFDPPEKAVFAHQFPLPSSENFGIGAMYKDERGALWIGTRKGLVFCPDPEKSFDFNFHPYPGDWFGGEWGSLPRKIIADPEGKLWLTTFNGVVIFNPATRSFQHIFQDPEDPASLGLNGVTDIFMDAGKVIWIGTAGRGLSKYAGWTKPFRHYLGEQRHKKIYSIYGIAEDKQGDIWASLNGGLLGHFGRREDQPYLEQKGELLNWQVTSNLLADGERRLWFMSQHLLVGFDPATGQRKEYPLLARERDAFGGDSIPALHLDYQNQLWACHSRMLFRIDRGTGAVERFELPFSGLRVGHINALVKDKKGQFWLGAQEGLLSFDPGTGDWRHYHTENGLEDKLIKCLLPDPAHPERYLWVGSSGGLHRLDMEQDTFRVYTEADGLTNNFIYGILADDTGHLWISTPSPLPLPPWILPIPKKTATGTCWKVLIKTGSTPGWKNGRPILTCRPGISPSGSRAPIMTAFLMKPAQRYR